MNKEETTHEIKSPDIRTSKFPGKNKNIYEKYSILKKNPTVNKVKLDYFYFF